MPDVERTSYATPIPLRDNESGPQPNPYTRLEAAQVVRERLQLLGQLVQDFGAPLDVNALAGVLETLATDLRGALWGNLAECERLAGVVELRVWGAAAATLLWPARMNPEVAQTGPDA